MKVICIVREVIRLKNTLNGNPMFRIVTSEGVFKTKVDTGFVYGIDWPALDGKAACLSLNKSGIIVDIEVK